MAKQYTLSLLRRGVVILKVVCHIDAYLFVFLKWNVLLSGCFYIICGAFFAFSHRFAKVDVIIGKKLNRDGISLIYRYVQSLKLFPKFPCMNDIASNVGSSLGLIECRFKMNHSVWQIFAVYTGGKNEDISYSPTSKSRCCWYFTWFQKHMTCCIPY